MEKIKDALEKARGKTEVNPVTKASTYQPAGPTPENVLEQANETNINAISYTNTKTLELNSQHLEKNRIVAYNKSESATWIFDKLRTQVLQKMHENNWKTLAILSPTPASGKSFVAINLAISIANQPQKTAMLVDFDLRKPRVAKYLGLDCEKSLNDYLEGRAELHEVLVNPGLPRLVILPTMKPVSHPAEVLSSARVNALIQEISTRYESRIVIYDLPPILNADDALIMLKKVDCALLVVGNGMVKETEIEEAMHHIPKDKLLGVVLNKAEVSVEDYYY
ncbi:MAG: protein tyrosine kinase [Methylophilaceae bacterium 17-44-8]|nr:MAG: protein tyrosine kinase [Methylophilales bacterium 28-44-11]OZA05808.1 MAG: protein tyrosine kinase [Methylophilaceae bacterium 17-44-8]